MGCTHDIRGRCVGTDVIQRNVILPIVLMGNAHSENYLSKTDSISYNIKIKTNIKNIMCNMLSILFLSTRMRRLYYTMLFHIN